MLDCAYAEIGKHLGLPTQAYIALSDAKRLDAQAGLESSMGATLAALAGINNISGPGMLDFESCLSLEKLVLDNEIAGMVLRLTRGMEPREDFPALPRFRELLKEDHLLISKHTRKYLREEHHMPGPVIDRANRSRWEQEGGQSLRERAHQQVGRLLDGYEPSGAAGRGEGGPGAAHGGGSEPVGHGARLPHESAMKHGRSRFSGEEWLPARDDVLGNLRAFQPGTPDRRPKSSGFMNGHWSCCARRPCPPACTPRLSWTHFAAFTPARGAIIRIRRCRKCWTGRRGWRCSPLRSGRRAARGSGRVSGRATSRSGRCWIRRRRPAADHLGELAERRFLEKLAQRGEVNDTTGVLRYSPGYCGWHISGQRKLFDVLEPSRLASRCARAT